MKEKWNKMSVEDKHIMEGTPDSCVDCPIALAMKDYEAVFNNPNAGFRPHINIDAEDWFGEDEDGAMSHRIIVHPDDAEIVQSFIEDFDHATDGTYSDDDDEYYGCDKGYRKSNFPPFTFRYRVVDWKLTVI